MRDARLDFFRGLAIYMIFIDHVNDDPLRKFTFHMIGFSDAAELFVFVSGLACGIAYSRTFARQGLLGLTAALAKRVGRIYLFYALSSVAMILLVAVAMNHVALEESFGFAADSPLAAISSALALTSPPLPSAILVLYIILTSIIVPILVVARDRYRSIALAASGALWLASQFLSTSESLTHWLFFNPLAWQFLFAIGVTLGIERDCKPSKLRYLWQRRSILVAAWAIVLGALLVRVLAFRSGFNIEALRLDPATAEAMKANLSFIRLAHFVSVAYLVSIYFHHDSAMLKWRISAPVIKTGMHSLEVFSLSLIFDVFENIVVSIGHPSLNQWLVMDGVAILLLALTATALGHRRAMTLDRAVS